MGLTTFAELKADALERAGQASDGTSDVDALAGRQIVRAAHEIENEHAFLFLRASPPYAFATVAPLEVTVAVTNGSTAIMFAVAPTPTVAGRELLLDDWGEAYRIATHNAAAQAATLDVAFQGETNAAATGKVVQREYDLTPPLGLRHIVEMVVSEQGCLVEPLDERKMREEYPDPPSGIWPPRHYARIGETRIRFNGYPLHARRLEVAHTVLAPDIDGENAAILIPANWRYVIADGANFWILQRLNDSRSDASGILFAGGREKMIADDARKRTGVAGSSRVRSGPYG
jgi:hypothetical protein